MMMYIGIYRDFIPWEHVNVPRVEIVMIKNRNKVYCISFKEIIGMGYHFLHAMFCFPNSLNLLLEGEVSVLPNEILTYLKYRKAFNYEWKDYKRVSLHTSIVHRIILN